MTVSPCLGIIAGHGDLPRDLIQACKAQGIPFYILAFEGQTDPAFLIDTPHDWVSLGQVGTALKLLKKNHVNRLVMAGYFQRPNWTTLKPDLKGLGLMSKLVGKPLGDDALFRIIISFFEGEGFQVISADDILGNDILIPAGVLTDLHPDAQALSDIERGVRVAKALGLEDVGQSVVMQQGLVLGVEALEGSDALIRRTAPLKQQGPGGVFIKIIKPQQDTRVDRSVIGPQTVKEAAAAGLRGIAAEAQGVILLNPEETIRLANTHHIFIVGI